MHISNDRNSSFCQHLDLILWWQPKFKWNSKLKAVSSKKSKWLSIWLFSIPAISQSTTLRSENACYLVKIFYQNGTFASVLRRYKTENNLRNDPYNVSVVSRFIDTCETFGCICDRPRILHNFAHRSRHTTHQVCSAAWSEAVHSETLARCASLGPKPSAGADRRIDGERFGAAKERLRTQPGKEE